MGGEGQSAGIVGAGDVITHDLGRRAPYMDVVAPGYARVLMSARVRSSHVLAVSSSFKHIV